MFTEGNQPWFRQFSAPRGCRGQSVTHSVSMGPGAVRFALCGAAMMCALAASPAAASVGPSRRALPVPLHNVRLSGDSVESESQGLNLKYLQHLDVDRLLFSFRETAGLDTRGAEPYPGWEDPSCLLRGHFVGHYLSALALSHSATDKEHSRGSGRTAGGDGYPTAGRGGWLATTSAKLVAGLIECQQAIGSGYLSAFPPDHFDRVEARQTPVWAPYYTIHKIMAGLLDTYAHLGSRAALQSLIHMTAYFKQRIDAVIAAKGWNYWQQVLEIEFGGMNECMYDLYMITGHEDHLTMAGYFLKEAFMAPLAIRADSLQGKHANTHIPTVIGAVRGFLATSNATLYDIATAFYDILMENYTFVTGGNNVNEYWLFPGQLGEALVTKHDGDGEPVDSNGFHTEESCTVYNTLKLIKELFSWAPTASLADMYERQVVNGIMGTQLPGEPGHMLYMTPLGAGVSRTRANFNEGWGLPDQSFWCCYGSGIESFSKLGDGMYFQSQAPLQLWVLRFVSSTVYWQEGGMSLRQTVSIRPGASIGLAMHIELEILHCDQSDIQPQNAGPVIHIRVPAWALQSASSMTVNSRGVKETIVPSKFVTLRWQWAAGDRIIANYGMEPRVEYIKDNRPEYAQTGAIVMGPYVLAGLTDINNVLDVDASKPNEWLHPDPEFAPEDLRFIAQGQSHMYQVKPLNEMYTDFYTVYFNFSAGGDVGRHSGLNPLLSGEGLSTA